MQQDRFNEVCDELLDRCREVLQRKNLTYAAPGDKLKNFKIGAQLRNTTELKLLWGYLMKHIVSIQMLIDRDEQNIGLYLPKIIDSINYLILLYAILKEEKEAK